MEIPSTSGNEISNNSAIVGAYGTIIIEITE
jgi:hypothetical protein